DDARHVGSVGSDLSGDFRSGAGKNAIDSGGITHEQHSITRHAGSAGVVQLQQGCPARSRFLKAQRGDIRAWRNTIDLSTNALRAAGKVRGVGKSIGGSTAI